MLGGNIVEVPLASSRLYSDGRRGMVVPSGRCRQALRLSDLLFTYIESLPTYNYRLPILRRPPPRSADVTNLLFPLATSTTDVPCQVPLDDGNAIRMCPPPPASA